ncbi:hypothetical protein ANCDUO_15742, partial [Ancylostoma duodenale]
LIYEKCNEEQQHELKILLCKIFEPDLCPLPFETVMFVCDWINMAIRVHYDVFITALIPDPEEEGRYFEQTKEGLGR